MYVGWGGCSFWVLGCVARENEHGWGNFVQMIKTECMGLALAWAGKSQLAYVQGTCTVICVLDLRLWVYAIMCGWVKTCETKNKMLNYLKF